MRRVAASLGAVLLGLALAGCSDDGGSADGGSSEDPLEVTVGEEFTWNDFTVEEGWKVTAVEREVGIDEAMTSPEVKGSVVNNAAEERFVIFEMVFSRDGNDLATVNCTAQKLAQGQSGALLCPGFGQTMPADYDTVTVQPLVRGDEESTDGA